MYSRRFLSFFIATLAIAYFINSANAAGTASWYVRGTAISSNASVSLNTGDSLTAQCNGLSMGFPSPASAPLFAVMFGSSSTTNPVLTVTITAATSPTPIGATVAATSGTLIYDSFNGAQATWSHWLFSTSIILPSYSTTSNAMSRGILNLFIPSLISTDAGTMYCVFADGATYTQSNLAFSNGLTISLTTTSSTGKTSRNKYLEYSMLLLGATKLIL